MSLLGQRHDNAEWNTVQRQNAVRLTSAVLIDTPLTRLSFQISGGGPSEWSDSLLTVLAVVEIECAPTVELYTKDSNPEDSFWERRTRQAHALRNRDFPRVYTYAMNIGETGKLVLRCQIRGDCQIRRCSNIPLKAAKVAIQIDGHPWQDLQEFRQDSNPENLLEIVAHLTEDAFKAIAARTPCRQRDGTRSRKYVHIGVKVDINVGEESFIEKTAKTEMYCRVCSGSFLRFVRWKFSDLNAYLPQTARHLASDIGQGTLAVVKFPRNVKNKLIGKSDGANT